MSNPLIHPPIHPSVSSQMQPFYASTPQSAPLKDYIALLKPRVMSLVVFTALCSLLMAPGTIHPLIGFTAILCLAVGAGASGCLNMWYEAEIDTRMKRTQNRPLPSGRVQVDEALTFGVVLSALSVLVMWVAVHWVPAVLLAFTIFYYVVVYTMWLKPRTPQNIVIGGAAGALPPMIAWSAVTHQLSWESFFLFLIIFLWTPAHFWALALLSKEDYANAGIPMLPNVHGDSVTKKQINLYAFLTAVASYLPLWYHEGVHSWAIHSWAMIGVTLLNIAFIGFSGRLLWSPSTASQDVKKRLCIELFIYSIFYLFVLFLLYTVFYCL